MTTENPDPVPDRWYRTRPPVALRPNGIYRFRGREYTAMDLATEGQRWDSTALICWPKGAQMPTDIIYLRHGDGALLSVQDFQPIGTLKDLIDTGRTAEVA